MSPIFVRLAFTPVSNSSTTNKSLWLFGCCFYASTANCPPLCLPPTTNESLRLVGGCSSPMPALTTTNYSQWVVGGFFLPSTADPHLYPPPTTHCELLVAFFGLPLSATHHYDHNSPPTSLPTHWWLFQPNTSPYHHLLLVAIAMHGICESFFFHTLKCQNVNIKKKIFNNNHWLIMHI